MVCQCDVARSVSFGWCVRRLVLVVFPLLPVITATICSVTSLCSASFPRRAPVAVTWRPFVSVFAPSSVAAAFAMSSVLLLLPVLEESDVCQGVQRRVFSRLVLAYG